MMVRILSIHDRVASWRSYIHRLRPEATPRRHRDGQAVLRQNRPELVSDGGEPGAGGGQSFAGSPAWRSACQRSGNNSSIRRAGWVLIRSSTSRRYACGSIPRSLHVVHRLIRTAAVSPPLSLPTNSQFFRLCGAPHNRNYAGLKIMRSRPSSLSSSDFPATHGSLACGHGSA